MTGTVLTFTISTAPTSLQGYFLCFLDMSISSSKRMTRAHVEYTENTECALHAVTEQAVPETRKCACNFDVSSVGVCIHLFDPTRQSSVFLCMATPE